MVTALALQIKREILNLLLFPIQPNPSLMMEMLGRATL